MSTARWRLRRSALLGVGAVFVSPGLARAQHTRSVLSDTGVVTYAAVLRAADAGQLDTVAIDAASRSPETAVRTAGARALAQLAPTHRIDAARRLRALLASRDLGVRMYAAFGLGLAHDSLSVDALASILRGTSDSTVARAAAWSLGEIGAVAAHPVDALLTDASVPLQSTRYLLLAASRLPALSTTRLASFLASPDTSVRWAAAYALARPHRPGAASALLALGNEPSSVRAEIARALTATAAGDSLRKVALARLARLARDPDPIVRVMSARALGTYGADARSSLVPMLRDRDPQVRVATVQSATTVFGADTAAWNVAWRADTAYRFRRSVIESAAGAGWVSPGLTEWMHSADWRRRAAAISALGDLRRDTTLAIVLAVRYLRDPDPRVRGAVYGALATLDSAARDPRVRAAFAVGRVDSDTIARDAIPGVRDTMRVRAPAPRPLAWYERVVRSVVAPALAGRAARVVIQTERGPITVSLYGAETPLTVWNFATLAQRGFYDGLRFHRVVPAFVAQDGDPRGDGEGGPPYTIRDELTPLPYVRGAVGMALSGPDTGGSQYFVTLTPQPHLDGHYTVFGMVIAGASAMDALREGDLIRSIRVSNFDSR